MIFKGKYTNIYFLYVNVCKLIAGIYNIYIYMYFYSGAYAKTNFYTCLHANMSFIRVYM